MIRKILWLLATFLLAHIQLAAAQQPEKIWRIGFLGAQTASRVKDRADALQQGLREFGYAEGKNLVTNIGGRMETLNSFLPWSQTLSA